jgi:TetR/AcrR family transcriptional repressor of nem operon
MNAIAATKRDPDQTRQSLLDAAFEEIWRHGFQASSLDRILEHTGVTKGALYYHFKNKLELGYAVVEEVIRPMVVSDWLTALAESDDPLTAIMAIINRGREKHQKQAEQCGCPLNNLAQEMSAVDEGFRTRIASLFESWRRGMASALRQGQAHGTVRQGIDADNVATFILASIEGTIGLMKNAQSMALMDASLSGLEMFLESLRPAPAIA